MHTDPELLSLLALGEHVGSEHDLLHVESCPECADEVAELHRLITLGRGTRDDPGLVAPSDDVWAEIRAELGFEPSGETEVQELSARAELVPVGAAWSDASGTATLNTDPQGRRVLQVDLHAHLPASGVRQAWLLHREDPAQRQTLGILDGPHGLWTVAHSIDLDQFSILDISQQAIGQNEHSGQSLVRGELTLVG